MLRTASLLILTIAINAQTSNCVFGQEAVLDGSVFSKTANNGWVFINGKFINPPYKIEATNDRLFINGHEFPADAIRVDEEHDDTDGEYDYEESGQRGQGGHNGVRAGYSPVNYRPNDNNGRRRRGRPGAGQGPAGRRPTGRPPARREREPRDPQPAGFNKGLLAARNVHAFLEYDEIIGVFFDGQPAREIRVASDRYTFCDALANDQLEPSQIDQFVKLAPSDEARATWKDWAVSYNPPGSLHQEMLAYNAEILRGEEVQKSKDDANKMLQAIAYPLTIFGMILGVIAFGHMMQWTGKSQTDPASPANGKFVSVALLLMLAMSMIDLIWTALAVQAGIMSEVNPIAARFIHSPLQLVVFKFAATGLGFAILYVWRNRRQIQMATWWMCLVCVLLTFRWVVFDSMIN